MNNIISKSLLNYKGKMKREGVPTLGRSLSFDFLATMIRLLTTIERLSTTFWRLCNDFRLSGDFPTIRRLSTLRLSATLATFGRMTAILVGSGGLTCPGRHPAALRSWRYRVRSARLPSPAACCLASNRRDISILGVYSRFCGV